MEEVNTYSEEKRCHYQGRDYLARDNGAIFRFSKDGCRPGKYDNIWTFGEQDERTGYMLLASQIRVHQVVARAFHGDPPEPNLVVDHMDTNRANNRPENLRWATRLENALGNPITRKRIIIRCGSIEAFLENPALLRENDLDTNNKWMRTVSKEEAAKCRRNLERWAAQDSIKAPKGEGIGEWIFDDIEPWDKEFASVKKEDASKLLAELTQTSDDEMEFEGEEEDIIYDSLTPNVRQVNRKTPNNYPLCPQENEPLSLEEYASRLSAGKEFNRSNDGEYGVIVDFGMNPDEEALFVLTHKTFGIKNWGLCKIYIQDGYYMHEALTTCFSETGGRHCLANVLGQEWDGPECIDDYCD